MTSILWQTVFLYSARSKSYIFRLCLHYTVELHSSQVKERNKKSSQVLCYQYDIKGKSIFLSMLNSQ